jgi:hypothetical protein
MHTTGGMVSGTVTRLCRGRFRKVRTGCEPPAVFCFGQTPRIRDRRAQGSERENASAVRSRRSARSAELHDQLRQLPTGETLRPRRSPLQRLRGVPSRGGREPGLQVGVARSAPSRHCHQRIDRPVRLFALEASPLMQRRRRRRLRSPSGVGSTSRMCARAGARRARGIPWPRTACQ